MTYIYVSKFYEEYEFLLKIRISLSVNLSRPETISLAFKS